MSIYLCNLFHSIQFISSVTRFPFVERLLFLTGCDCLDSRHSTIHNDGDPEKTFHTGSHRGQFVRHSVRDRRRHSSCSIAFKANILLRSLMVFSPFPLGRLPHNDEMLHTDRDCSFCTHRPSFVVDFTGSRHSIELLNRLFPDDGLAAGAP